MKLSTEKPPDTPFLVEKRTEPRLAACGTIWLEPEEKPACGRVLGELVDLSTSGFRVAHNCKSLQTGDEVSFAHHGGSGRARVVWMRISADGRESGFYVISRG